MNQEKETGTRLEQNRRIYFDSFGGWNMWIYGGFVQSGYTRKYNLWGPS